MATYLMLGKYTTEGIKGASASRTKKVMNLIEKAGGQVDAIYALLGDYDIALLAKFPGNVQAAKASFDLSKITGIAWSTHPAVPVEEFDRLIV